MDILGGAIILPATYYKHTTIAMVFIFIYLSVYLSLAIAFTNMVKLKSNLQTFHL